MIPWVSVQPHTWPLFPLPAFLSDIPTPFTYQIHSITNLHQVDIEKNIELDRLPIHQKCNFRDWINQKLSSPNVASGRVAKTGAPAPSPVSPSTVGSLENIIRGPSPARYVLMLLLDCRIPLKALTCDNNIYYINPTIFSAREQCDVRSVSHSPICKSASNKGVFLSSLSPKRWIEIKAKHQCLWIHDPH